MFTVYSVYCILNSWCMCLNLSRSSCGGPTSHETCNFMLMVILLVIIITIISLIIIVVILIIMRGRGKPRNMVLAVWFLFCDVFHCSKITRTRQTTKHAISNEIGESGFSTKEPAIRRDASRAKRKHLRLTFSPKFLLGGLPRASGMNMNKQKLQQLRSAKVRAFDERTTPVLPPAQKGHKSPRRRAMKVDLESFAEGPQIPVHVARCCF